MFYKRLIILLVLKAKKPQSFCEFFFGGVEEGLDGLVILLKWKFKV